MNGSMLGTEHTAFCMAGEIWGAVVHMTSITLENNTDILRYVYNVHAIFFDTKLH